MWLVKKLKLWLNKAKRFVAEENKLLFLILKDNSENRMFSGNLGHAGVKEIWLEKCKITLYSQNEGDFIAYGFANNSDVNAYDAIVYSYSKDTFPWMGQDGEFNNAEKLCTVSLSSLG